MDIYIFRHIHGLIQIGLRDSLWWNWNRGISHDITFGGSGGFTSSDIKSNSEQRVALYTVSIHCHLILCQGWSFVEFPNLQDKIAYSRETRVILSVTMRTRKIEQCYDHSVSLTKDVRVETSDMPEDKAANRVSRKTITLSQSSGSLETFARDNRNRYLW